MKHTTEDFRGKRPVYDCILREGKCNFPECKTVDECRDTQRERRHRIETDYIAYVIMGWLPAELCDGSRGWIDAGGEYHTGFDPRNNDADCDLAWAAYTEKMTDATIRYKPLFENDGGRWIAANGNGRMVFGDERRGAMSMLMGPLQSLDIICSVSGCPLRPAQGLCEHREPSGRCGKRRRCEKCNKCVYPSGEPHVCGLAE